MDNQSRKPGYMCVCVLHLLCKLSTLRENRHKTSFHWTHTRRRQQSLLHMQTEPLGWIQPCVEVKRSDGQLFLQRLGYLGNYQLVITIACPRNGSLITATSLRTVNTQLCLPYFTQTEWRSSLAVCRGWTYNTWKTKINWWNLKRKLLISKGDYRYRTKRCITQSEWLSSFLWTWEGIVILQIKFFICNITSLLLWPGRDKSLLVMWLVRITSWYLN